MPNHLSGVQWTTTAGTPSEGDALRIVRAPWKGWLHCMILSHKVEGTWTHYANGRPQPCFGESCPSCKLAMPTRWHGWAIIAKEPSGEKAILEFPRGPADLLAEFFSSHRTLRGLRIKLTRPNGKSNGRVHMLRGEQAMNHADLPRVPELQPILMKIWGLDKQQGLAVIGPSMPPTKDVDGQTYIGRTVG